MRRAVVITGLIRDEAGFASYLEGLIRLARPDLRIILSTWTGELARYPAIASLLARLNAEICEQPQPNLKLPGHMLHQVMALDLGLSRLDRDVFVLKTRPDICGVMDVHEFLDLLPQPAPPGRLARPFGHRVHVVGLFGAHPLYINDIVYAGMAADLRRLCALPFHFGLKYPRLAPEQWLWSTALAPENPVLDAYLSINPGLLFSDRPGNATLRNTLAQSWLFASAIAITAILARDCLAYLHPDPELPAISAACAGLTIESLLWGNIALPGLDHHPTAEVNTFLSGAVIAAIHDGAVAPSVLGDAVRAAMDRYGGHGGARAMEQDKTALAAAAAALGRDLGLDACQSAVQVHGASTIPGGLSPWAPVQTGLDHTAALEAEVNHLRRVVDQLQAKLRD